METLDRKKIGMNIKVRRMQKLISQTAMAEKLGISQTHMSNVEVGRAMLSLELLLQLKNILGCTIDELLCLEDENKPRKKPITASGPSIPEIGPPRKGGPGLRRFGL